MTAHGENPAVRRLDDWSAERLAALADEYDAPLYVLDLDRVRENYRRMAAAFPDADVHYAAKANTVRPVLQALADEGAAIECASAGELVRAREALRASEGASSAERSSADSQAATPRDDGGRREQDAGVPGERVQYTAVNPPARDLDRAVEVADDHPGLTITVGAEDTAERLAERGYDGRLCVRVNPGVGAGHHEKVSTGADAKFGVPYERVPELVAALRDGFDVVGIHAHAGSGISGEDLSAHRELVSRMGDLARELGDRGLDLEFVDIGGGFGVPYRPDEDPLDLEAVADATRDALGDVDATLTVEPGRYLVADAGVLLTRVNTVKRAGETTVVGVDAGMTALARPAMYDAHHEMRNLATGGEHRPDRSVTVAGPVCESGDTFGEHWLRDPERGDLLAVGNAGAYGYEMASQYNSRPRPASVVLAGDRATLSRRRETIADVTAREREARQQ